MPLMVWAPFYLYIKIRNNNVLKRANSESIESLIMKFSLWWSGHVETMEESKFPCQVLLSDLTQGKRYNSKQHRKSLDHTNYWCSITIGTRNFKVIRREEKEIKWQVLTKINFVVLHQNYHAVNTIDYSMQELVYI